MRADLSRFVLSRSTGSPSTGQIYAGDLILSNLLLLWWSPVRSLCCQVVFKSLLHHRYHSGKSPPVFSSSYASPSPRLLLHGPHPQGHSHTTLLFSFPWMSLLLCFSSLTFDYLFSFSLTPDLPVSSYWCSTKVSYALMDPAAAVAYDMSNNLKRRGKSYDPALIPVIMLCNPW